MDDQNLVARIQAERSDLLATELFENVTFEPVDADGIQRLYQGTKNKVSADESGPGCQDHFSPAIS
jgi:hypothetical protein